MVAVRSLIFNLAFFASTLAIGIAALPLVLAPPAAVRRFGARWSGLVLWLLRATTGTRWEVRGAARLPAGPAIFAAKHQSAWDTIFFPAYLGDPAMVAKKELRLVPFYGWYAWRAGTVWLERGGGARALRAMARSAMAALAEGRAVVVFPQGTRTAPGEAGPYLPGIAALYAGTEAPVVPVALNSGLYWGKHAFLKRPGTIIVEFLDPLPAGLGREQCLGELARRIETATRRLEAEAREGPPPPVDNSVDEAPHAQGGTRA